MALKSDRLDPIRKRLHKLLQEFSGIIVDELAVLIEELVGMTDIGFGLLHGRHVQKHERLPQMMIGAEGSDRARRATNDRTRLAVPDATSEDGASDISAFASIPLNDAFRRLPSNTHTFIGLSKIILRHNTFRLNRPGLLHSRASIRARRQSASIAGGTNLGRRDVASFAAEMPDDVVADCGDLFVGICVGE